MHLSHEVRLTSADTPRFKLRPVENLCYNRCWKPVHLLRLSCSLRQCQVNEKVLGRPLQTAGGGQPPRDTRFVRVPWQGGEGVGAERGIRGARSARRRALGWRLADRHLRQGLLQCDTPSGWSCCRPRWRTPRAALKLPFPGQDHVSERECAQAVNGVVAHLGKRRVLSRVSRAWQ